MGCMPPAKFGARNSTKIVKKKEEKKHTEKELLCMKPTS